MAAIVLRSPACSSTISSVFCARPIVFMEITSAASKSPTPSEPPVEAELHPSRDEVMAILGAVAEAVTVQDVSGQLIYANDAAARIRGIGARTVPSVAGGICQVATTLFQRVFR